MSTRAWVLEPPPPPYPTEHWRLEVLLMNACIKHRVKFTWTPGDLFIPLKDIDAVLTALLANIRV